MVSDVHMPERLGIYPSVGDTAGQIPNLPLEAVVEINAVFERDVIRPIVAGAIAELVRMLIMPHVENHELTLRATLACARNWW
jgi:alpha-galactosidase